jgi:hypothetical protein
MTPIIENFIAIVKIDTRISTDNLFEEEKEKFKQLPSFCL